MNFRYRTVSILSTLAAGLALAAGDARAPEASDRIAVALAPAIAMKLPDTVLECAAGIQSTDLHIEMISSGPNAAGIRELPEDPPQRAVAFEWNPQTGELSYNARAAFRLRENRNLATPAAGSCESR